MDVENGSILHFHVGERVSLHHDFSGVFAVTVDGGNPAPGDR